MTRDLLLLCRGQPFSTAAMSSVARAGTSCLGPVPGRTGTYKKSRLLHSCAAVAASTGSRLPLNSPAAPHSAPSLPPPEQIPRRLSLLPRKIQNRSPSNFARLFTTTTPKMTVTSAATEPSNDRLDFRSDTVTKPTKAMYEAMFTAELGDDVLGDDPTVHKFEQHMVKLTGHEAALFCVSGTMTNQIGLRTLLTQPPHSVLCDVRAHVHCHEAGGIAYHSQASVTPVLPANGHHLTVDDVKANVLTEDVHYAPTRVVALENTLNGTILPLDEIKRIRKWTQENGIKLHLDGARLWNASAETGISIKDYAGQFDSVSLCMSKGIGAPIGSVLLGNKAFIEKARHFRKLFGGGWRQAGIVAAGALHALNTNFPAKIRQTHEEARLLARLLTERGFEITSPTETNMVWVSSERFNVKVADLSKKLKAEGIQIVYYGARSDFELRIVVHVQTGGEKGVHKLADAMARAVGAADR